MKKILCLLLSFCLTSYSAAARYEEALKSSKENKHELAFKQFIELSELGNKDAQYNIGLAYLQGHGVKPNDFLAYAWIKLSSTKGHVDYTNMASEFEKAFTQSQLSKAVREYEKLLKKYDDELLEMNLYPSPPTSQVTLSEAKAAKKLAAIYPKSALRSGTSGSVFLGCTIGRDGRVKYPFLKTASSNLFVRAAKSSFKKSIYRPAYSNGKPIEVYGVVNRYMFEIINTKTNKNQLSQELYQELDQLKNKMETGTSVDRFYFASVKDMFRDKLTPEQSKALGTASSWYAKAAVDGLPEAKFNLGSRLLAGRECEVDANKSYFWLKSAAKDNHPNALFTLGLERLHGIAFEQDESAGLAYLKRAVEKDFTPASIEYAMALALPYNKEFEDLKLAEKIIFSLNEKEVEDKISFYEAQAVIASLNGNKKARSNAIKKLKRNAKKLDLPRDILVENIDRIINKQPVAPLLLL